jgi:PEP-CTERM motif
VYRAFMLFAGLASVGLLPCQAELFVASGAGSTPGSAQDLTGLFPSEIVGSLSGLDQNDVNMFKIDILNPVMFSAITVDAGPFGIPDTVLSLFDASGVGVYLNDDISGSNTLSCLPSGDLSNPCPTGRGGTGPLLSGIYYLAVSRSANYPVDSSLGEIFSPVSSTDVVGPVNTNPVAGWDSGAFVSPDFDLVNYDIVLTGTVPEPGTLSLLAGAVALLAVRRKCAKRERSA